MNVKQKIQDPAKATTFVLLSTPKCRNKTLGEKVVKRTKQLVKITIYSMILASYSATKDGKPYPNNKAKTYKLTDNPGWK